jgi:signal transduction histidine kinase
MPILVGLLVVTFAIAADLAHEAWTTALSQQKTAARAARDFVRFAATSAAYEARASIDLGLRPLFAPLGARGSPPKPAGPDALERSAARLRDCRCAPLFSPSYYFQLGIRDGNLVTTGDASAVDAEGQWLRDTVIAHARLARRANWDATLISGTIGSRARIVAYTVRGDSSRGAPDAYGFVADAAPFGDVAFGPLAQRRARGDTELTVRAASFDSLMRTFVLSSDGRPLYEVNPRRPELRVTMVPRAGHETYAPGVAPLTATTIFADTVSLGAQYGDLRLEVALTTTDPETVIAGAVPRSRFLVLLGLLLLMGGLVALAVLQLRREHELTRLRADLTAGVSHELRTPLAQILLFGETLMLERTRSERERRAAAEVIVREARRLMHLVENALHFARADRKLLQFSPESIDLAEATRDILVTFAPLAWTANVTLREVIEEPARALIDAAAYRQIVLNLLENAVRYGPAGQTVTVRVERGGDRTRLAIEDEGPGIPMADRDRVWAPFVRLTNQRPSATGTGIGLAVVRDLTARHGGRAWIERAESGGARVIVELPAGAGTPEPRKELGHDDASPPFRAAL